MRLFGTVARISVNLFACAMLLISSYPSYAADRKVKAKVPGIT